MTKFFMTKKSENDQKFSNTSLDIMDSSSAPSFECNVRGKLEAILAEQIARLLSCGLITSPVVIEITDTLRAQHLLPEQIESTLCAELKLICSQRYETAMPESTRFNGFGWSESHLKEHMRRLLKSKLSETATVLRTLSSRS